MNYHGSRRLIGLSLTSSVPGTPLRCSPLGNFRHVYQAGIPDASEARKEDLLESPDRFHMLTRTLPYLTRPLYSARRSRN
jgi:hypothetical protein